MMTWPNMLTASRIAMAPVLIALILSVQPVAFLGLFVIALLTDFADGFLARRLHQQTPLGARLDTLADMAMGLSGLTAAFVLWPHITARECEFVVAATLFLLSPCVAGLMKYGRATSYHTWSAKTATASLGITAIILYSEGPSWPFHIAVVVAAVAAVEEVAITVVLPTWTPDVRSLRQALARRRTTRDAEQRAGTPSSGG